MPLRGQSAVVIWSDMADPAAHDLWHSREHLPERVAISRISARPPLRDA